MNATTEPKVTVTIEIPRWSFVKYAITEDGGHVEFISPLPCPFNYGFVAGLLGGDSLPLDAIVLGSRTRRRSEITLPVRAIVRFTDSGDVDDKLVCSETELTSFHLLSLRIGFRVYVLMKRLVNWARRKPGPTSYHRIDRDTKAIAKTIKEASVV